MKYLFAHAHPDDETLASGALIASLVDRGHEVYVLTATRGEEGEVVAGSSDALAGSDALVAVREGELKAALRVLNVSGSAFLGTSPARVGQPRTYRDSGMVWVRPGLAGPRDANDQRALSVADPAEVAADIAAYARAIEADEIVSYNAAGGYGHPDHVRMHDASILAAALVGARYRSLVDVPGERTEWFELGEYLPRVKEALSCHATQLSVVGDDVVHSGGQREAILTSVGLADEPAL